MTGMETERLEAARPRLSLLGAGRLGDALAKVWRARTGEPPLVWSRGGPHPALRAADGVWVADWTEALQAQAVFVAIPGRALLDLAEGNEQARAFEGEVISAAPALSHKSLQSVFPKATVIRVAPFLIDGANSIPTLALRPPDLPDPVWERIEERLRQLGDVDVVHDDRSFDQLYLVGAAWPVVLLATVQGAAEVCVRGLQDEYAVELGRSLFFRAVRLMLSAEPATEASGDTVATPGGITERGLRRVGELTVLLDSVFDAMRARTNELRAEVSREDA